MQSQSAQAGAILVPGSAISAMRGSVRYYIGRETGASDFYLVTVTNSIMISKSYRERTGIHPKVYC